MAHWRFRTALPRLWPGRRRQCSGRHDPVENFGAANRPRGGHAPGSDDAARRPIWWTAVTVFFPAGTMRVGSRMTRLWRDMSTYYSHNGACISRNLQSVHRRRTLASRQRDAGPALPEACLAVRSPPEKLRMARTRRLLCRFGTTRQERARQTKESRILTGKMSQISPFAGLCPIGPVQNQVVENFGGRLMALPSHAAWPVSGRRRTQ